MRLHWHPVSLMPWRVKIALAEKGLPCDEAVVNLPAGESREPGFLALNPFGQVPVLEDGDLVLSESIAILEYLDEHHPEPPLMPSSPADRAIARQFMCWSTTHWMNAWKRWVAPRSIGIEPSEAVTAQGRLDLADHLDVLETRLAGRDWIAGPYSLADICYAPLVVIASGAGLSDEIAARPNVSAWLARLADRRAVRDAMGMLLA